VPGAQVTVTVREIRSRHVFFLGGVVRPGPIQLTEGRTILQALSAVGEPLSTADLESVFVLRGMTLISVNIQRMLQEGDLAQNLRLQSGDTVVVPARLICPSVDCVWVSGAVNAPGPVKYTKDLTIKTAIEAAGGFTPYASRLVIIRRGHRPEEALLFLPIAPRRDKEMFLAITPNLSPRLVPTVRGDAPEKEAVRIELKFDLGVNVNANIPLEPNDVIVIVGPQRLF